MLRPLFFLVSCLWIATISASTHRINPLAKLPRQRPALADYHVSSKTPKETNSTATETESWWPLWRTSPPQNKNTTSSTDPKPVEKDKQKDKDKPKRRWGRQTERPSKKKDEKDEEKPQKEDAKKKKKKESKKEESKRQKRRNKKEKSEELQEETDAASSNATDATTSNSNTTETESRAEQEKKKEALERYKELHKLRQQMLSNAPPGSQQHPQGLPFPMSPEQHQRQMRNAAASIASVELIASVLVLSVRFFFFMSISRWIANRMETMHPTQHFVFERLNDRFVRDAIALKNAIDEPPIGVSKLRWGMVLGRRNRVPPSNTLYGASKLGHTFEKTVIVMEFGTDENMDLKYLADLITFVISQHQSHAFGSVKRRRGETPGPIKPLDLEVVFKLNSPGGAVATFGLAAAQVLRLRHIEGITTTVCVDKYAASGGYMIASQANKLVAAPFAYLGSIGVIMETLNFHEILRNYGVQPITLKAGDAKNPLTTYGPVTKKEMAVEQERVEKVHEKFIAFTIKGRPQLEGLEAEVCDGSVFMGEDALRLNLIDEVKTSDEYLMERMQAGDRVLRVSRSRQSRIAPHLRVPSPLDILPHLRGRVEAWFSQPDVASKLVQVGSFLGFLHHVVSNYIAKPPN